MFGRGGGMVNGCAIGTEQCLRHCRPYQLPLGTIRYPCVPYTVYCVPSGVTSQWSRPAFALPYSGKARYVCTCPFPIRGLVMSQQVCHTVRYHQCNVLSGTTRYLILPALPSLFEAKLGASALVPSLIQEQVGKCMSFTK